MKRLQFVNGSLATGLVKNSVTVLYDCQNLAIVESLEEVYEIAKNHPVITYTYDSESYEIVERALYFVAPGAADGHIHKMVLRAPVKGESAIAKLLKEGGAL